MKECLLVAIPTKSPIAFDKPTIRTKARTSTKSYIPTKPDKYGIWMYLLCGWRYIYCYIFLKMEREIPKIV